MRKIITIFYEKILGGGLVFLLLAVGIFFWFYLRLAPFQKRKGERIKGERGASFRALSVALAGTLGIGNIAGVSLAILTGGAGAIFWMWISALVAMLLKYAEIVLACRYKTADGEGGAMYYIRDGIGGRAGRCAAGLFAVLCLLLSLFMGGGLQAETVVSCFYDVFGGSRAVYGALLAILTGAVVFGGVRSVSSATAKLVPFMTVLYIAMCFGVLFIKKDDVVGVFSLVFKEAMQPLSAGGGVLGFFFSSAVRQGVTRGLLSNEAGCGTAPMAHVTSGDVDPVRQGRMGMVEVFVDTVVICTLTGISILAAVPDLSGGGGMALVLKTFDVVYGAGADYLLAISVFFFAYATIICWGYYGENCIRYLWKSKKAVFVFRLSFCIIVFCGSLLSSSFVWSLTDVLLAAMTFINLFALLSLAREVKYGRGNCERVREKKKIPVKERISLTGIEEVN